MNESLFVDASAWYALFSDDDKYHQAALNFWQYISAEKPIIITNDYVMDETYTLLRRSQNGLARAIQTHRLVEGSKLVEVVNIDLDYRRKGWDIFQRYSDKVISFTDCVSFGMMQELGIYQVFTFDSAFARAGFVVRPR